ncbi:hypothetical protein LTS08_005631 [Lithohypha guttulata]|nr:hypothetical protein LTS08_005631 [Lithohypha guttulata]
MDKIDRFFAYYPDFDYNRTESSPREFYRMCDFFDWGKNSRDEYPAERLQAQEDFRRAMVENFNDHFGTDVDDLQAWEHMCVVLGIEPLPESMQAMKAAVKSTHVNLADLLDNNRSGAVLRIFDTQVELAQYTRSTGRFFPKEDAYAGGLLRFLLREITGTYHGRRAGQQRSRKKR